MLNARHPARFIASVQKVIRRDCELNFGAVAYAAMTPMTHDHVELHLNYSLRSFCIYYSRLIDGCQVKYSLT